MRTGTAVDCDRSAECSQLAGVSRTGLTLVELLVVIAVITILAGLALPVISRSKDRGVRTVDINNFKQLVTATHLYASENEDMMPWPNWGYCPGRPGWLYTFDQSASGTNRFRAQTGVFWPILQNTKTYWCPQDQPSHPMFQYRGQQSSSYVMNGAVCGYDRSRYPALRLGEFSADAVLFWETDEQDPGYFNDGASRPVEGVSKRHDAGALSATFGGAAQYVKFDAWYLEIEHQTLGRLWCYPGSTNGR